MVVLRREGGKTEGIKLYMLVTVGRVTQKGKIKPSASGNTLVSSYVLNKGRMPAGALVPCRELSLTPQSQ